MKNLASLKNLYLPLAPSTSLYLQSVKFFLIFLLESLLFA